MDADDRFAINKTVYEWSVRAFALLEKRLSVKITLHHADGELDAGQIFVFNHFARFETIIPHYLIYKHTGAFCRSVAASELFSGNDTLATYLRSVGAMPTKHPGLLAFLAAELLRGRKVIVFPEGGMVKDRRVMDGHGGYSVFSRSAHARRKQHRGAAVIALTLETFKQRILSVHAAGETARLERWVRALGLDSVDALLEAARKPTLIVPGNITFYPIRIDDNVLRRGVERFSRGISTQASEELVIEGNILFKDTDMDIRLGEPIAPGKVWKWWERLLLDYVFRRIESLEDLFALTHDSPRWQERLFAMSMARQAGRIRDAYMHAMYAIVTVNLCHLASRLILHYVNLGRTEVSRDEFHRTLYLAVKCTHDEPAIHLHRSLAEPEGYEDLLEGHCQGLEQFLNTAERTGLIERRPDSYHFLPKLRAKQAFDRVRLENPIAVYANEAAPLLGVSRAVARAVTTVATLDARALARLRFDDERLAYVADKARFSGPQYAAINEQETATESAEPYLLVPKASNGLGVVLIHGFLSSPAELRAFAERLAAAGHPVIGVRLKGHGTSPWDLRERSWQEWQDSVRRGYRILAPFAERLALVGFSTGGALALGIAAERPPRLAGVAAVSAPIKFRNRNLIFVPLVHHLNTLAEWLPAFEGIMPFRPNDSEHPHINYRHIPLRALYELRLAVDDTVRRLGGISCPVFIAQGTEDHVVDSRSARLIMAKLGPVKAKLHMVETDRHGILNENVGGTQEAVLAFLASLPASVQAEQAGAAETADAPQAAQPVEPAETVDAAEAEVSPPVLSPQMAG